MRIHIGSGLVLGLALAAVGCGGSTDFGRSPTGGASGGGSGGSTAGAAGAALGGSAGAAVGGSGGAPVGGSGGAPVGGSGGEPVGGSGGVLGGYGGEPVGGSGGSGAVGSICTLPPDPGPCMAYMPSYYFDYQLGRCKDFIYGGCQGNANRFATYEACRAACGGPPEPVCSLPADVGPCDGAFMRYWFNAQTGRCELFSYGGCEGNANNFETAEECLAVCGSS